MSLEALGNRGLGNEAACIYRTYIYALEDVVGFSGFRPLFPVSPEAFVGLSGLVWRDEV